MNQYGCDSLVITTTNLPISDSTYLTATSCNPADTGTVAITLTSSDGCDSIVITVTTLLPSSNPTYLTASSCNPQDTGTVTQTLMNQYGCDSLVITTTNLPISDSTYLTATSCNPADTGTVAITLTSSDGCDSIIITVTTLLPSSNPTYLTASSCNPQDTGTVTQTLMNQYGCDSLVITTTNLLASNTTYLTAASCDISEVGIDTIILINSVGCDSLIITTTTLSSLPFITISNDTTICEGQSVQLNGYGGVTYSWSPSIGLSNPNIATPIATPITTTTYALTIANNNGCNITDSVMVTVNSIPVVVMPLDTTICQGDTIQVLATATGMITWSPNTVISNPTVGNPFLFPSNTTVYYLTVTNALGCTTMDSMTVNVITPPIVTISPNVMICESESVQLNATGGVSYVWSPSASLNDSSIPNPIATPTATTTYQLVVSNTLGCISNDSVTITVNDTITPYIIQSNRTMLTAFPTGGGYTWFYADTLFTMGIGFLVTNVGSNPLSIDSSGYYRVRVADANGCEFESQTIFINVVGTQQSNYLSSVKLMPNPTKSYVDIQFESIKRQDVEVIFFNNIGQRVYTQRIDLYIGNHIERLNIDDLPSGLYIVRIQGKTFMINKQLIIAD
jgi:hypothetical protein